MKDLYEALGKFALAILNLAYSIGCFILSGYVLSILWAWFIIGTFGLPVLTIPVAMGIMVVVSYLTKQPNFANEDKEDYLKRTNILAIVKPLGTLAVGWIIKSFI